MAHPLSVVFEPRSIVVVGASEDPRSLGCFVLQNVLAGGFDGTCFAVNPRHQSVLNLRCYPSLVALPQAVDLAVITAPATAVPTILTEAAQRGVKAAVILSAGFGKKCVSGRTLQEEMSSVARQHGIRILGPNCLGLTRGNIGLNASFARAQAKSGKIALVAQSGAICSAMLDLAASEGFGFSSVISLGVAADLDFGEILDYLRQDDATEAILLYIEGVRDGADFMRALRNAALAKPVVAMKPGRYASGCKAAFSHSGVLMGRDEVFDAALRRCGALRVNTYTQLIGAARTLASGRFSTGRRLGILTNGGGLAVIAADVVMQNEVELATLSEATVAALSTVLPASWSQHNPIDIVGDADAYRYGAALQHVLKDKGVDALLVLYCPTAAADPVASARAVAEAAAATDKPVLAAWLDSIEAEACANVFEAAGIAHFSSPEDAVEAFSFLTAYRRNQRLLREGPEPGSASSRADPVALRIASNIAARAQKEGRRLLSEHEARNLLLAFGLPVTETVIVKTKADALEAAQRIGFPVALKIHSPDISHKSDVGGVRLNLRNAEMVASDYDDMLDQVSRLRPTARVQGVAVQKMLCFDHTREVLIGIAADSIFGRVITFGAGGVAVEALKDSAVSLPPLDPSLAHELIGRTRIQRVLSPYRNIPGVHLAALTDLLVQTSQLCNALPWLAEMDLNPVLAHPGGAVIADARIVIAEDAKF